jgi:hypothetical protein
MRTCFFPGVLAASAFSRSQKIPLSRYSEHSVNYLPGIIVNTCCTQCTVLTILQLGIPVSAFLQIRIAVSATFHVDIPMPSIQSRDSNVCSFQEASTELRAVSDKYFPSIKYSARRGFRATWSIAGRRSFFFP